MIAAGRSLMGQTLHVPMPHGPIPVEVVNPVFLDPKGERLDA